MKLKILCTLYFLALAASTVLPGTSGPGHKHPFHPAFEQGLYPATAPCTGEARYPASTAAPAPGPRLQAGGQRTGQ